MLRTISISSLILLFCLLVSLSHGQVRVVDVTDIEIDTDIGTVVRFLPDVEGKVLVHESLYDLIKQGNNREGAEVFPGYPVAYGGANERGGVYCQMDDDPELELAYPVSSSLLALNIDGTPVPGWPQILDYDTDGAASFGDIDGDGIGEIVVTTHQVGSFAFGSVYAFETDGTNVQGFPVPTEGGGVKTPVLADLNSDGALEIIITVRDWPDGLVYVFRGNGILYPGWPVRMDYVPGSDAAVGDIDGDDIPEIVVQSYNGLHVFSTEGALRQGFPYYPGQGRVFSYSTPVLADIDGDGNREIICGDHSIENGSGAVHIVKNNGTSWFDWPFLTAFWIYGPPSVGDINDDGLLDIVVGDQTLSGTPVNQIYAWTAVTGEMHPGFPITEVNGINSQILLVDLDGDGMVELLADDNTATSSIGNYPAFNHDGTRVEGWALETFGSTFFVNPMVLDVNDDGILDISGGGVDPGESITSLYLWNSGVTHNRELDILTILQYNTRHNGVYGDTLMVGIEERGRQGDGEIWGPGEWETWRLGDRVNGNILIFPNPAWSFVNVRLIDYGKDWQSGDIRFIIYNSVGEECLSGIIDNKSFKINIESLPTGIFWITLRSEKKVLGAEKFVISK